jgi:hypothetical protein
MFLMAGCGSSMQAMNDTAASNTGSAVITINWPQREAAKSRVIPPETNSIVIRVLANGELARRVIERPSAATAIATRFDNLPVGPVTFTSEAFASTDGTGTAVASGSQIVNIAPGVSTPVVITMVSAGAAPVDGGDQVTVPRTLNVLTTNIVGQDVRTLVVAVFSSTGAATLAESRVLDLTAGVNERSVAFSLPPGTYTVVSATTPSPRPIRSSPI